MNTIVTTTEIKINKLPIRNGNAEPTYCITDGMLYQSATDAAKAEGITPAAISHACNGRQRTANKKMWCYLKDLPERILDISNVMAELVPDAEAYRAIKAEERRKEEERLEAERKERENAEKKRKLEEAFAKETEKLEKIRRALLDLENGNETMTI